MTELIYCANGNARFAEIALKRGYTYGAQLPGTVYFAPDFCDQNWQKPDRARYMAALAEHRPRLATVLDLERDDQLEDVLSWAAEAAQHVTEAVIIIPKAHNIIARLPREIGGRAVRLGYSVPTRYAGTEVMLWEFAGWPVHLLGGSPNAQIELSAYLDAVSADGNYAQKLAKQRMQWHTNGHNRGGEQTGWSYMLEMYGEKRPDDIYKAWELSCVNIRLAWSQTPCYLRWAKPDDISAIDRIARQYPAELGWVRKAALQDAMARGTLWVAVHEGRVCGYIEYRTRKDGGHTVYSIAVDRALRGRGVGRALMSIPVGPVRLKCPVDNPANGFYAALGYGYAGREAGRVRELERWISPPEIGGNQFSDTP